MRQNRNQLIAIIDAWEQKLLVSDAINHYVQQELTILVKHLQDRELSQEEVDLLYDLIEDLDKL